MTQISGLGIRVDHAFSHDNVEKMELGKVKPKIYIGDLFANAK